MLVYIFSEKIFFNFFIKKKVEEKTKKGSLDISTDVAESTKITNTTSKKKNKKKITKINSNKYNFTRIWFVKYNSFILISMFVFPYNNIINKEKFKKRVKINYFPKKSWIFWRKKKMVFKNREFFLNHINFVF